MSDVGQHEILAGEMHQPAVVPHQPVGRPVGGETLADLLHVQALDGLQVVAFDQKIQRAVHRGLRLAYRQPGFVRQSRIAGGVDEAVGFHSQTPEAGREVDVVHASIVESDVGQHGPHDRLHARSLDLALHPASKPHLVVLECDGRAMHSQQ